MDFRGDLEVTIEMMEQLADIDSSSEVTTCCQLLCDCLELLSEKMNAQHTIINKHHKVPRLFVGTKKWQSVRRQNGSGSVEICRENASAVNMEPDGSLKLRVED